MNKEEAIDQAIEILRDEANSLALIDKEFPNLPHRIKVAVQREINRFREICAILQAARKS